MERLLAQLQGLPTAFQALSVTMRWALGAGLALAVALAVLVGTVGSGNSYQYVFTNLTQEDSGEASVLLKTAGIPYRLESNGSALAVPRDQVYEARLLLATAGLPRGGGVGFELFDRGDLGVSEFTQRVNLRRAIEGELARTVGRLSGVRSAKVTVTLPEKGLYRDEDKPGAASVVVALQPGRGLGEKELSGIRHLIASAVPGLGPGQVTVLDGRGAVLSQDTTWDAPEASYARRLERDLEQRVVSLLEPVVGQGAVVARVSAAVDASRVNTTAEVFDPDATAVRSERKTQQGSSTQTREPAAVAGAAANVPLQPQPEQNAPGQQATTTSSDEVKNFEISRTSTTTVATLPRLVKLSVAIIVDGLDGKARPAEEVARLGELARKAVGFDEARGDQLEIVSQAFGRSTDAVEPPPASLPVAAYAGGGVLAVLLVGGLAALLLLRGRRREAAPELVLRPGSNVAELEARAKVLDGLPAEETSTALPGGSGDQPLLIPDPLAELREKARALVRSDPERALTLLRTWLADDLEKTQGAARG